MDEDLAVKAPVTRLRRRMSVEAEDSPLPTTPSTPTKKRATRLAAKPQLELIDEVATENAPKRATRKAAVKENVEADTVTGTPTPVTPSRRSTRIRSNTSILSETTSQNIESPRAKRALRRTSQLGSDTESSALTPARQTRRTRKDSATNADKPAGDADMVVYLVSVTDTEDTKAPKDSKNNETDELSPSTRKSPRLQNKKGGQAEKLDKQANKSLNNSVDAKSALQDSTPVKSNYIKADVNDENTSPKLSEPEREKLSTSSVNLINEMETKDNQKNNFNKSTSAIEKTANDLNSKRNRTKSWTTLSPPSKDINYNKEDKESDTTTRVSISGGGDGLTISGVPDEPEIKSPNRSLKTSKASLLDIIENQEAVVTLAKFDFDSSKSDTAKLFENSPHNHEAFVLIEDSDSCSGKLSMDIQMDGEDQCVPVVANPTANKSPKKHEQSVEPMDIDESMPANVTIDDFSDKSNTSKEDVEVLDKRKSLVSEKSLEKDECINKSTRNFSKTDTPKDENDSINMSIKNSSISVKSNSLTSVQKILNSSSKENPNTSLPTLQAAQETDDNEPIKISEKNSEQLNESLNKSKKKSSVSLNSTVINESRKSVEKAQRKSSISINENNTEKLNESSNKSNRKSYNSLINTAANESKKSLDKSQRTSSLLIDQDNIEKLDESKSKIKSSISQNNSAVNMKSSVDESKDSSNKSQNLEKTENENKSTLIISQLKDEVSANDTHNAISPNVTNAELSKSMNGPDVKNKGIDKKNLSLNYLTSTPIQQKPLQKLAMQINTSIISPGIENKNITTEKSAKKNAPKDTIDSDSSDETDEEIKFKNKIKSSVLSKKRPSGDPSSDSSDEESATESKTPVKKSPIKKVPHDNTSTDSDSDSKNQPNNKKTPNKKLSNQSKSDSKVGANKIANKKKPFDSSDSSENSDEEASKDRSKIIEDEAFDAGDDYESGDSQNEDDRRYDAENEIVEKGETLDSDDEFSNDSDYEKDSFIVSSDAEDNEILSGTGDDLSFSDNELTMSAKSKSKFNERKLKQQKKASREMYEARHKKDESVDSTKSETTKSRKSKRQRLESSTLESENEGFQAKKSNRLRIDSSQDSSLVKSEADESIGIKKKKSKRLSESVHETTTNEKEITLNQSTTEKNDPLTVAIKQEPKTPQKHFNMSTVAINDNIEEVEIDSNTSIMKRNETLDPLQATMVAEDDDDDSSSSDNMEIIQNYDSVLNNLNMQTKKIKTVDTSLNLNKKCQDSKDPVFDQLNLTQTKKSKNIKKTVEENKPGAVKSQTKESSKVDKDDEGSSDSIDMKLLFPEDSNDSEINVNLFKPKINEEPIDVFIPLKRTEAHTNIPSNMDKSESELNVSKKKKEKRKSSLCAPEDVPNSANEPEDSSVKMFIDTTGTHQEVELGISMTQTNSSKKNKNKKNKSLNQSRAVESAVEIDFTDGVAETPVEISFTSEKKKKKNKNKSFDVSVNNVESSLTVTESQSAKKNRNSISTSEFVVSQNENTDNTIVEDMTSVKSDKKQKKNKDVSQIIEPLLETKDSPKKKTKKTSINVEDVEPDSQNTEPQAEDIPAEIPIHSKNNKIHKKKNKRNLESSHTNVDNTGEESDDAPMEMSYKSEKKSDATDTVTDEALTSTEKKTHKKNKKKKKNKSLTQSMEKSDDAETIERDDGESSNRKRKASGNPPAEVEVTTSNETKKRKIHLDDECLAVYEDTEPNNGEGSSKKLKKKNKSKNSDDLVQDELPQHNNTKKRKNRDDDNEKQIHKVSKQNSFDKIHMPKIPESVIKQLSENPRDTVGDKLKKNAFKKKKAATVIATMPFVVEEAKSRKNKPSNYLEQSVYLNDSPVQTKQKQSKDRPKVLPFIPTAVTSDRGYTSKFNINVLPGQTQFVAQSSNVENFRESFLGNQRIKKLGTFERCKIHRSLKLSKF